MSCALFEQDGQWNEGIEHRPRILKQDLHASTDPTPVGCAPRRGVFPKEVNLALIWGGESQSYSSDGGLSGAGSAYDTNAIASLYLQVDSLQDLERLTRPSNP